MNESISSLGLRDDWRVLGGDRLIWADAMRLDGDPPPALQSCVGLGGCEAVATIVVAGPDIVAARDAMREGIESSGVAFGGATIVNDVAIGRILGEARAIRESVVAIKATLRPLVLGFDARLPRVWAC
jgi:urease accessory protein